MKKIKIAFDVDGVFVNFMQTISNFIEKSYLLESKITYSTTQYSLYDRFISHDIDALGFDNIKLAFEKKEHWKNLEAMPNIESIKELLHNPLYDIYFITSLPPHLHSDRQHNLEALFGKKLDGEKIFCVPLGESKKPYVDYVKPDYFIEDNLINLVDCHGKHTSLWIDLEETCYERNHVKEYNINQVKSLNEAISHIRKNALSLDMANSLILAIQEVLTDDLLTPMYAKMDRKSKTEGHCYASSEAVYHMLGGNHAGLTPCVASFEEKGQKMTHWWLKDKKGNIIDPTAEQFYAVNQKPPYELGKGAGFLTKQPSKRAQEIIGRIVLPNSLDKELEITTQTTKKFKR